MILSGRDRHQDKGIRTYHMYLDHLFKVTGICLVLQMRFAVLVINQFNDNMVCCWHIQLSIMRYNMYYSDSSKVEF